ncbi:MAG TPA: Chromate resistance protein ChrB [Burkholderiaceae bacterium]|nr:Chromate resistance protein ChrB [Burkholderiaceae bacterium]
MNWIALVLALPTSPSAVRVRVWRALKSSGCGALRDGVYLLPKSPDCARVFEGLAQEVRQADGEATLLTFAARDAEQQEQFESLFDRSGEYKALERDLLRQGRELRTAPEAAGRRALRALAQRLDTLRGIDFFADERGASIATPSKTYAWNVSRAGRPESRRHRPATILNASSVLSTRVAPGSRGSVPGSIAWRAPGWCCASSTRRRASPG